MDLADAVAASFITYGGFDGARYLRRLVVDRLREAGAAVPATLRVQRDAVGSPMAGGGVEEVVAAVAAAVT